MLLQYIETASTRAPYNLAFEEALLKSVTHDSSGFFLLWQNSPSVIIGRHQNAFSEVNLDELTRRHISLVRRMSGGGAVYHDMGNLNFSFILLRHSGQQISQARLLEPIIKCLGKFGVAAVMEGRNDLSIPGKGKFSGLAGYQLPGKYLLHGTIMYDVDLSLLEHVLNVDAEKYQSKGVASVRARVANLRPFLPGLSLADLWSELRGAYNAVAPTADATEIAEAAQALVAQKYGLEEWNMGKSPAADIVMKRRFAFGSLELHLRVKNNIITGATITGDFLSANNSFETIEVRELEKALLGLPGAGQGLWAKAWQKYDLRKVFYGTVDQGEVLDWLAGGSRHKAGENF